MSRGRMVRRTTIRRLRERLDGRRRGDDRGLTLVELLISMVLAVTLGGVIVAAIVTSLNVADATSDGLKSSIDIRLISAYLGRDAQGAAAVDPKTAKAAEGTGVSVTDSDWGGCTQDGDMVVRFSWIEYLTVTTERSLTVTYALDGSELSRALCIDGVEDSTLLLGRNLSAASALCRPNPDCSGSPTEIELTFSGTNDRSPYTTTLSASLRSRGQGEPTVDNSSIVSLLALGNANTPAPCTNLSLGTSKLYVEGDAVVANECGPTSIDPSPPNIEHVDNGTTSLTANLSDPLAAMPKPSYTCGSGSNPSPVGTAQGDPTVYPQAVTIASGETVTFAPGRYVFCKGLTIQAGATVTSSATTSTDGVLLYIATNTLTIDPAASVELTAAGTGPQQRIVIWATGSQTVQIGTGTHITRLGGTVYAPQAKVQLNGGTGAAALNVGSIVAATIGMSGIPTVRVGPVLPLDIDPTELPSAETGTAYSQQLRLIGSGAATLDNPVWTSTGLTPFSINSLTGEITGTPQCPVDLTPSIRVVDSNGVAVSRNYTLKATAPLRLDDPGSYVRGTVTLTATLTDTCGGVGTSVSIQYALSGADENGDSEPDWATLCTMTSPVSVDKPGTYTCTWDTTASPFASGDTYDLRAIATLPNSTTSESDAINEVLIDNTNPTVTLLRPTPEPVAGTVTLVANADDGQSGIRQVIFKYGPPNSSPNDWTDLCVANLPADPAFQDIYKCEWNTVEFSLDPARTSYWDIHAVAIDRAGNVSSDTETRIAVNNSGASISVVSPGSYVRATVSLTTNTNVPAPATVTSVKIQYKASASSTWIDICTDSTDPFSCSWNTALVSDGAYDLRAIMTDSRAGDPTTSATISVNVDNALVSGVDVQALNGSKLSLDGSGKWILKTLRLGRLDQNKTDSKNQPQTYDRLLLTYSKQVNPASIISGWAGTTRTVWIRLRDKGVAGNYVNTNDTMDVCSTWTSGATCAAVANLGWVKFALDTVSGGKTAIFEARISHQVVSGRSVVTVEAILKKANDSRGTNLAVMVWTPNAAVTDSLGNSCSTRPAAETGTNDKDF